jgi:hypothetical protein
VPEKLELRGQLRSQTEFGNEGGTRHARAGAPGGNAARSFADTAARRPYQESGITAGQAVAEEEKIMQIVHIFV